MMFGGPRTMEHRQLRLVHRDDQHMFWSSLNWALPVCMAGELQSEAAVEAVSRWFLFTPNAKEGMRLHPVWTLSACLMGNWGSSESAGLLISTLLLSPSSESFLASFSNHIHSSLPLIHSLPVLETRLHQQRPHSPQPSRQ